MSRSQHDFIFLRKYLSGYFSFAIVGAFGGFIYLMRLPSDAGNGLLGAYSAARLGLMSTLLGAMLLNGVGLLRTRGGRDWLYKLDRIWLSQTWVQWAAGLVLIASLTFVLIPFQQFERYAAYAQRLLPLMIFGAQMGLQTLLLSLHWRYPAIWRRIQADLRRNRKAGWVSGAFFGLFVLAWGLIAITKLGLQPLETMIWYETGVPVLGIQVLAGGLAAGGLTWFLNHIDQRSETRPFGKWLEIGLLISLWAITAFWWNQISLPDNYFAPKLSPTDTVYLPYSDAAAFDLFALDALLGKGLANGHPSIDHSAYIAFLGFLHLIAGHNYNQIVQIQVSLFAVFPVLGYAIGKKFQGRFLGFFLAGLVLLQETNALNASNRLNLSNTQLLLTEFPTKILLALMIWLLLGWLKNPHKNLNLIWPIGGALGLAILVRYNVLVIIPVLVLVMMIRLWGQWKFSLKAAAGLTLAIGITIAPWMWRSWQISGNPFFFAPKASLLLQRHFRADPIPPKTTSEIQEEIEDSPETPTLNPQQPPILAVMASHFTHNLMTNVLILPTRAVFDYFPGTIRAQTYFDALPYWNNVNTGWLHNLTLTDQIGIGVNLAILALGLGKAHQTWGWVGGLPLGISLAYHASTALARRSGGRFIVPVDWIVLLYFGLGLLVMGYGCLTLFGWRQLKELPNSTVRPLSLAKGLGFLTPFLLYVLGMVALDQIPAPQYQPQNTVDILALINPNALAAQSPYTLADITEFLTQPEAEIHIGMSIYPRFMWRNRELGGGDIYFEQPYPRLATKLNTWDGFERALLPLMTPPDDFLHGSDLIVLGCHQSKGGMGYVYGAIFIVLDEPQRVYTRTPERPLACPLAPPVCENNTICE